jgi:hypothetical protein
MHRLYRAVEAYPLLIAGRWWSPVMLPEAGVGHRIAGELYEVDDATISTGTPTIATSRAGVAASEITSA